MKRTVIVIALIVVLAGIAGYEYWLRTAKPTPVDVAVVRRGTISVSFTADAIVKVPSVDVSTKVMGRLTLLSAREGATVRRGQVLARIDSEEMQAAVAQSRAAVTTALAAVRQTEAALSAARKQFAASRSRAEAELAGAEADLQRVLRGPRTQEIAQAKEQVTVAQARCDGATLELGRARELYAADAIPKARLDEAEEAFRQAQAQLNAAIKALELLQAGATEEEKAVARARVDAAKAGIESLAALREEITGREAGVVAAKSQVAQAQAALAQSESALSSSVIVSPVDGTISRVPVERGEIVSPQTTLVTIVTNERQWVEADVSDEDAAKVRIRQVVSVTSPGTPGRKFAGTVFEISPQGELKEEATLRTRIVRVKVRLADGVVLKPGLAVDVEGRNDMATDAVLIPSDAMIFKDKRNMVFLVVDGKAVEREIRTGYFTHDRTEVLSGLRAGDRVIVAGKDQVSDGHLIVVRREVTY
jgi:HlyD family secretion protein